jgi:hypothetical protein
MAVQVSGAAESVDAAKSVLAREEAAAELLARSTGSAMHGKGVCCSLNHMEFVG